MTLPSHVLLGVAIGAATGNVVLAVLVSVLVDVDHVASYARHGVLFSRKKLVKTLTSEDDPYGDQRGWLHNIFVATALCAGVLFVFGPSIGITFALAYAGHLILDALDAADYWPLYPIKIPNVRGLIRYYTWDETLVDIGIASVAMGIILL